MSIWESSEVYSPLKLAVEDIQQKIDIINKVSEGIQLSGIDDMAEKIRHLFWYALREVIWDIEGWMAVTESYDKTSCYPEDLYFDDSAQAARISYSFIDEPRFIEFSWDGMEWFIRFKLEWKTRKQLITPLRI